jgi:hypothetical protein
MFYIVKPMLAQDFEPTLIDNATIQFKELFHVQVEPIVGKMHPHFHE